LNIQRNTAKKKWGKWENGDGACKLVKSAQKDAMRRVPCARQIQEQNS